MVSKLICTWPPIRSSSAGPLPLYGMWVMKVPAWSLNSSAAMCWVLPEPLEAKFSLPGFLLGQRHQLGDGVAGRRC
jgi:hypothetical protein